VDALEEELFKPDPSVLDPEDEDYVAPEEEKESNSDN